MVVSHYCLIWVLHVPRGTGVAMVWRDCGTTVARLEMCVEMCVEMRSRCDRDVNRPPVIGLRHSTVQAGSVIMMIYDC